MKYRWNGPFQGAAPWANFDDITNLYSSWNTGGTPFTASISRGSSTVIAQNGYTWTQSNFNSCSPTACSTSNPPFLIWFTSTGTAVPTATNNSQGDAGWYFAVYVNSTTLKLTMVDGQTPVPYTGSCGAPTVGVCGWEIAQSANGQLPGYFVQPFMVGILNRGFYFANLALSTVPLTGGGYDTTDAALAANFALQNAIWMASTGVNSTYDSGYPASPVDGLYYIRQNPACEPPGVGNYPGLDCDSGFTGDRDLNGEGLNVATYAFLMNQNSTTALTLGDTLMDAVFAAPGDHSFDGYNVLSSDIGSYMYSGNGEHKWFGYYWGIGGNWSWASVRLGGVRPPIPRVVQVSLDLPASSHAVLTLTSPDGASTQVACSSSPCPVTIDARQGDHLLSIKYENGSNQVLIPASSPPIIVKAQ
jgi:hypothetical protein